MIDEGGVSIAGTSKSAKRRQKEREKEQDARSLASRVGRQGEVRVLNSGGAAPSRPASREGKAFNDTSAC